MCGFWPRSASTITNKLILFICAVLTSVARADLFLTPRLEPRTYASLELPAGLTKPRLARALRFVAQALHGRAFIDLGEMSDFMHGHALRDLLGRTRAILFHTQEFPHLRANKDYVYRGRTLDPFDRSWLLWLTPGGEPERLMRAADARPDPREPWPSVVTADMLDPAVFGANAAAAQITFFFFRLACADSLETRRNTRLHAWVGGERVCLDLVSESCRAQVADGGRCTDAQALVKELGFGDDGGGGGGE